MEWRRGDYVISDDPARLDVEAIHRYLHDESYWAKGIPREVVDRSLRWSLNLGLYAPEGSLAGFARAVTDRATYAYLADVFVLEGHRGRGLGVWLVETTLSHPDLQGLRRIALGTDDAHALYARFGFGPPRRPERYLEIGHDPEELYGG